MPSKTEYLKAKFAKSILEGADSNSSNLPSNTRPEILAFGPADYWICCKEPSYPSRDQHCLEKNPHKKPKCQRDGCGHGKCQGCLNMATLGSHLCREGYENWDRREEENKKAERKKAEERK